MGGRRNVAELDEHVGYWLRFVSNHVSQGFSRKVEEHGVTVAEWVLLRSLLDAGDVAPSRLAEAMGTTRGTVTKLADRLIEKALVVRTPDAEDRRAQILSLTPAGKALVPKLAALADRNDAEFFAHLSLEERTDLVRVLKGIVERSGLRSLPVE